MSWEKMSKGVEDLNNIINQIKLIGRMYCLLSPCGTITKIHRMLGKDRSLNKIKKIEIIQSILSDPLYTSQVGSKTIVEEPV